MNKISDIKAASDKLCTVANETPHEIHDAVAQWKIDIILAITQLSKKDAYDLAVILYEELLPGEDNDSE